MNVKKSMLVVGTVTGLGIAGLGSVGMVSAATNDQAGSTDPSSSLVSKIASKFNLDKNQVQTVFDEERTAREAERDKQIEQKLSDAVKAGKLTEAQKSVILAKQKELKADMQTNRDSMKDKTEAERKTAMEAKRTELQKWATDNNIPTDYLRYIMGGGHGGHGGPEGDRGPRGDALDTSSDPSTTNN